MVEVASAVLLHVQFAMLMGAARFARLGTIMIPRTLGVCSAFTIVLAAKIKIPATNAPPDFTLMVQTILYRSELLGLPDELPIL